MARLYAAASAAALSLMLAQTSSAQTYRDAGGSVVPGVVPVGGDGSGALFTSGNPGKVAGTFSATFSGFQPTPSYSYQSVTTSSAPYALPTGPVVIFYNTGANPITVKLGGSGVNVTAAQADVIQPSAWMAFTVGSSTYYAVVGNGGTSTVVASGGSGLPTGAGGSGGGAGSWPGTASATAYGTSPGSGTVPGVNAYVTALPSLPAGANSIGSATTTVGSAGAVLATQPDQQTYASAATAATTQVVAPSAGKAIYVASYDFNVSAGASAYAGFYLEYGAGTACGTGTTQITAAVSYPAGGGVARGGSLGRVLTIPPGNALCIVTTAAQPVTLDISFAQY